METFDNLPVINPYVEIRQSKNGRGIFAKQDIPIGTKICYYDAKEVNASEPEMSDKLLNHFTDSTKLWVGIENPVNEWGIGQIANDFQIPIVKEFMDVHPYDAKRVKEIMDCYAKISSLNSSIDFIDKPSRWMYSTRFIKKDDEVIYSYGNKYWYRTLIENASRPLWRVIYFSLARKNNVLKKPDYRLLYEFLNFTDENLNTNMYNIPEECRKSNKDRVDYLWKFLQL
jgi:hypothetical protein